MVFLAIQTYGWSLQGLTQAGSGFGWLRAALILYGARDGARAKDGAVAQGMIFDTNSSIACNKTSFKSSSLSPNA